MTAREGDGCGPIRTWESPTLLDLYAPIDPAPEVAFYTALADRLLPGRHTVRALEIGVGTGRVLLSLPRGRFTLAGLDLSRPLLDEVARRAALRQREVALFEADFRSFRLRERFDLIYFPAATPNVLMTEEEVASVLRSMAHAAADGAVFAAEMLVSPRPPDDLSAYVHDERIDGACARSIRRVVGARGGGPVTVSSRLFRAGAPWEFVYACRIASAPRGEILWEEETTARFWSAEDLASIARRTIGATDIRFLVPFRVEEAADLLAPTRAMFVFRFPARSSAPP